MRYVWGVIITVLLLGMAGLLAYIVVDYAFGQNVFEGAQVVGREFTPGTPGHVAITTVGTGKDMHTATTWVSGTDPTYRVVLRFRCDDKVDTFSVSPSTYYKLQQNQQVSCKIRRGQSGHRWALLALQPAGAQW